MKYASVEIPDEELIRRREEVRREFETEKRTYQEKYPSDHWYGKVHNFTMILPHPDVKEGRLSAFFHAKAGTLNTKHNHYYPEGEEIREAHSGLWLDQTPEESFTVVDAVIANCREVSRQQIEQLQHIKFEHEQEAGRDSSNQSPEGEIRFLRHSKEAADAHRQIIEHTLPVYLELRAIGYTHADLMGG